MAKKNKAVQIALLAVGAFALYELVLKKPATVTTSSNPALVTAGNQPATAVSTATSTASALSSLVNSVKSIFSPAGSDPTQGTNPYKVTTPALEVANNTGQSSSPAAAFPTLSTNAPSLNFDGPNANAGSEVMNETANYDEALSGMRLVC